ncbi:putative ribosomal protein L7/L12 [Trypanosoma vivax]|uniref:Putative ribosomal protein L7/L12 n=1 Tax=Trypanosoma vivax (strain Y486) TaxID=1055687 RepID=G0TZP1_TRYVY|nr:putative ribosomal protein L7/L12 [Trypanosoma vivax]CCC50069.1 putative ribosomal protein L7/L12 [Trypanosoma vivax Y486]
MRCFQVGRNGKFPTVMLKPIRPTLLGGLSCCRFSVGVPNCVTPRGMAILPLRDSVEAVEAVADAYVNMDLKTMRSFHEMALQSIVRETDTTPSDYEEALLGGVMSESGALGDQGRRATRGAEESARAAPSSNEQSALKKTPQKTVVDVSVKKYPAENKVKMIKELRAVTGMPLQEAKNAIEKCPGMVARSLACDDAYKLKALLEAVGAEVDLL